MAKTIMISNEVYKKLKYLKGERSFSDVLGNLLNGKGEKKGIGLKECLGILKTDKEWEEIEKFLKRGWKKWTTKKYA